MKPYYGRELYLSRDDRKSSLLKFYLRSENFGLNARTQHGLPVADTQLRKSCKLCQIGAVEDEAHFMLVCPAFSASRRIMWLNLEGHLAQQGLETVWLQLLAAQPAEQLCILLGRLGEAWNEDAAFAIDSAVRQFILHAAQQRKLLVSE